MYKREPVIITFKLFIVNYFWLSSAISSFISIFPEFSKALLLVFKMSNRDIFDIFCRELEEWRPE